MMIVIDMQEMKKRTAAASEVEVKKKEIASMFEVAYFFLVFYRRNPPSQSVYMFKIPKKEYKKE